MIKGGRADPVQALCAERDRRAGAMGRDPRESPTLSQVIHPHRVHRVRREYDLPRPSEAQQQLPQGSEREKGHRLGDQCNHEAMQEWGSESSSNK